MHVPKSIHRILDELRRTHRLTADIRSFLRLATDLLLLRLIKLVPVNLLNSERCILFRNGTKLTYRLNRGDIWQLREVWLYEVYRLPFDIKLNTLIDLGAHIGLTSIWLAKHYGVSKIVAVEPITSNVRLARTNFSSNGIDADIIQAIVGSDDGVADFQEHKDSDSGRVVSCGRPVEMKSMLSIMRALPQNVPIDLVKVDIEGSEHELLSRNQAWLERVHSLIVEFHPWLVDYPGLVAKLQQAGFRYIRCNVVLPINMDSFIREEIFSSMHDHQAEDSAA